MKKFTRLKFIVLLIFSVLVFVGCNSDSDSGNADGVTELSFMAYSNYEAPLNAVIEEFEKEHENIKVNIELAPFANLMESIEIKMGAQDDDLDLIFVDSPLTTNYALKGYLANLDDYFDFNPNDVWAEAAVNSSTYDGELLAAPMNSSSIVLYLNKDIFEENNVAIPDDTTRMTWEETIELAKQLTYDSDGDGQNDVFGFSFDQVDRPFQLLALSDSFGVDLIDEDGLVTTGHLDSPEAVEAFQFYYDLYNTWGVSPRITREESIDYFISGNIAMYLGANHNIPKIDESDLNYSVTLHPYFENGTPTTPTGAWGIGVSAYSKNKEAAATFLEYLTAGDGAEILYDVGGTLPVANELLEHILTDSEFDEFPNKVIRISAQESMETAVPRPMTPGYLEFETNLERALSDIKNGTDPETVLSNTAAEIDRHLEKYK